MSTIARPLAPTVTSSDGDSYTADRAMRRHRVRLGGFSVCIALWLVSALPLARFVHDGRGAGLVALYLGVAAVSLAVASAIRGFYALLRHRQFWTPWIFALAAVVAIVGYIVQSAGNGGPVT